jgi:hypothetical protein
MAVVLDGMDLKWAVLNPRHRSTQAIRKSLTHTGLCSKLVCMEIDSLVKRPAAYSAEDGVAELMIGLMLVVTGTAFAGGRLLPKEYFLVPQAIWLCSALGMKWGMKMLKERVTSPRGGYVLLDEQPITVGRGMRIAHRALAAVIVVALMGFIVAFRDIAAFPGAMGVGMSVVFVATYAWGGLKYRLPHMLWLAAFSAVVSAWCYARGGSSLIIVFCQGAGLTVTGGIRLWQFVRSHPLPAGDGV